MTNPNARKGAKWEADIREHARKSTDLSIFRLRQEGFTDVGDLHLAGLFVIQAKDDVSHNFSGWLNDVEEQRSAAGLPFGVVVAKRRRYNAGKAYAVMDFDTLLRVAEALTKG